MRWQLYEINKYEKNSQGDLLNPDDWISIVEVGKEYDGKILTIEDYVEVEDRYVKTINNILDFLGILDLSVRELNMDDYEENISLYGTGISTDEMLLKDGVTASGTILNNWMRLCMRDILWSYLIKPNKFFVYYVDDFYVHIGSTLPLPSLMQDLLEPGIFGYDITNRLTETDIYDDVVALCTVN